MRLAVPVIALCCAAACVSAHAADLTASLTTLYQFPGGGDGLWPWSGLVDDGGTLYGTTYLGGAYGRGSVFKIDPTSGAESLIYSFTGGTDATDPQAGPLLSGGKLYGVSNSGAAYGYGGVYSVDPATGVETVVASFTPAMGGGSGSSLVAAGGYLYGTTFGGGTGLGYGTVFRVKITTGAISTLYSFTGGADGASPQYGVTYVGGMLYGTTTGGGGSANAGTLFAVSASTGSETTLFTFDGAAHGGNSDSGVLDVGGVLYGTTSSGGSKGSGVVFAYALSSGSESTVYTFSGGADGASPTGALISAGGVLYGTTFSGGASGAGTVFRLKPSTGALSTLYSFPGGKDGGHPEGPLLYSAGTLYGTDLGPESLATDNGTVFKIAVASKAETTLHDFQGASPTGPANSALLDIQGTLWGANGTGGAAHAGLIYTVNATSKAETTVYTFTGGADGGAPSGALIKDGAALYGVGMSGGADQGGVIYSLQAATGVQSVVYDFPAGVTPHGPLLLLNKLLYGTTNFGGANASGSIFAFDPATKALTTLYSFTGGTDGYAPAGGLTEASGVLYGTSEFGGANGAGVLFSFDPATAVQTALYGFSVSTQGAYPVAAPVYLDGVLYGTTLYGGTQSADCFGGFGCGVLYGYDVSTKTYSVLHSFTYIADGAGPEAGLLVDGSTLYGAAGLGASANAGEAFSYVPASSSFSTVYSFTGGPDGAAPASAMTKIGGVLYGASSSGATYNTGVVFSLVP
jgi:uncharacterized repeat protein (TIGR03803 family)